MAYVIPVGSSRGDGRANLPPECPGTSNLCAKSVKTKRQSHNYYSTTSLKPLHTSAGCTQCGTVNYTVG